MQPPPLRAVVCGYDPTMRHAVPLLLLARGFVVVGTAEFAEDAVTVVANDHPHVVVVDIASCDLDGMAVVRRLAAANPRCAVVVFSRFQGLRAAALRAGALETLGPDDLRPLLVVLEKIRAVAHAGLSCPCCTTASSGAGPVADPAESRSPQANKRLP